LEANSDYVKGWTAFTSAEIDAAKLSLNYIASLVDLKFVQSSVADATNTLSFANNTQTGSAGYALHPSDSALGSDVFLNDTTENREAKDGTYAALTLIHEIGHALGLKHPFSAPDSTGDSAPPPYLSTSEDVTAWTVMSYTSSPAEYAFEFSELDIAALQYLYGPSPTSRTTNDTYTVSNAATNFVWDGAGTDLLDASALNQPVTLYLTPGYWGYVGAAPATTITAPGQVTVNFGSSIENLKGGSQSDHLYGTASANRIEGGAGDDVLQGWDGSDTLVGGLGNDTLYGGASTDIGARNRGTDVAVFAGNRSSYQIIWTASTDAVTVSSTSEGTDTLWDIEQLQFADTTLQVAALRDTVAPTLMTASPLNGALRVPYDAPIVLQFNEAVQAGSGALTLKSGNATVASVDVTDSRYVKIQGSTVTITLPANVVVPGTTYTAVTTAGAIKDLAGNSWVPGSLTYAFTFTNASAATADIVAPAIDSAIWSGVVSPSAAIQIPFSEAIVRGAGAISLVEYNPSTLQFVAALSVTTSVAQNVLTLTPTQTLSAAKSYALSFSAGAIKDLAGNDFNFADSRTTSASIVYYPITVDSTAPVAPKFVTTASVISSVDPQVTFSTSLGSIVMELDSDLAPISTANMIAYVNAGLYDGTIFHRVIPGFMAQGGGFTTGMVPINSGYGPILNESANGLTNLRGTVAMARTSDLNSATSQFYINYVHNASLDGAYAVFGKVLSGMAVVDVMAQKPTQTLSSGYQNVPVTDITTLQATQTQQGQWSSTTGLLSLSDLETHATWQYSLNSGTSWQLGSGNYLRVPDGFYAAGTLQVRQTDAQGLVSSAYVFPGSLQVNKTSAFQLTGTSVFWKGMSTSPKALAGVQMSSELADKTDALGVVDLSGVESMSSAASGTVVLSPTLSSPTNAKSAISLTDVLAALKIYLGKSVPDAYASPLNYVAADFDASGSVNLTDVLQMLKYYLGKSTTNNVKPEWAFVDAADLSGSGSASTALAANGQALSKTNALPHAVDLDLMSGADTLQLVGVLRGDVDGSWTAPTN
jgi:cyclophilin family peptidyl-prolyl cis-trans isomerase/Ca2+-binding RTX toxin-like protein